MEVLGPGGQLFFLPRPSDDAVTNSSNKYNNINIQLVKSNYAIVNRVSIMKLEIIHCRPQVSLACQSHQIAARHEIH